MRAAFLHAAKFLVVVAAAAIVSACGGGDESPALSPQKISAAAASIPKAAALPGSVTSTAAAELLLDAAEVAYPSLFAPHQATQTFGPFSFRYYPQTGHYLGVVTTADATYTLNGVYVVGAGFGTLQSPSYQGLVTSYLNIVIDNNTAPTGHTLVVTVNVMGVVSTITLNDVPQPTNQGDFCSDLSSGTVFQQLNQSGGGTLTINSCSYSGNTGNISATMTITSPFQITVPYTITYTYT